jgi:predicted small lipoprotein YifL
MRAPVRPCLVALALLAGCGQKGPLVLPESRSTPVVIRARDTAAPAATPAAPAAPAAPTAKPKDPADESPPPPPR